jgi:hypothetical protein
MSSWSTIGRTCEVSPYSTDYEPMEVPLVDTAVKYDQYGRVYIMLIQNALYVPSMDHNLLPPFMMREAGVIVKDTPKIQLDSETSFREVQRMVFLSWIIQLYIVSVFSNHPSISQHEWW